jgi:membrane carboxypeptidase/penicillin-binding protein PbpC
VTPRGVVVRWPAAYQEWAASQHLLNVTFAMPRLASTPPAPSPAVNASAERRSRSNSALRVLSPPDGAVYLIDPTLRREFQTIGLRGATEGVAPLEWRVDDAPVGTSAPDASLNWQLTPGHHIVSARDPQGRSASTSIVVK